MKNNFLSKAVPRGTRTIWRYLSALLILFTFAIGQMWAEDTVFKCKMNGSVVQERNDGNSGDFFSFSFSSGSYSWKGGSDVTGCTYDGVNYTSALKFDSKPTLSFTTTKKATIIVVQSTSKNSSKAPKFDGTAMTSKTEISGANVWTITNVDAGSHNVRYSSEIWIHCVYVVYPAPAVNYTVTIDPNGGAYAEDPDGWTKSAGVYTKSIASGTSFTVPAGLTKGTDDLSWKDGDGNAITFPVSITGDITFVAQWAAHTASSDATLSDFSLEGYSFNETFNPANLDYTVTLPFYASAPETSAVTATESDANATVGDVTYDSTNKKYSVTVTAEDNSTKKTYTITLNWAATPAASSSINIEQLVLNNGTKYDIAAAFAAAHIAYDKKGNTDELDSLKNQSGRNEPYLGLKMKKTDASITVVVPVSSTLKVKFGNLPSAGIKVTINGVAQANHTSGNFELAATSAIREVVLAAPSTSTIVFKQIMVGENIQSVQLPWLVTYDAGEHGTCATAKEVWWGTALTLPSATPEDGWSFDGWNDDEDNPVSSPYTPTKDVTLTAQYTALASPFDLTALTYKIGTGDAVNVGYEDGTFTYNIELPYKPSYDAITVAPTLKVGTSSLKGDEVLTVSSLPGAATFTVVANDLSEKLYTINFSKAPKDGICLIKGNVGNDTFVIDEEASLLSGTADKNNVRTESSTYDTKTGWKFNARPARLGITLSGAETFQAGDIVEVFVTTVANISGANDKMRIFDANEGTSAHLLVASEDDLVQGANRLVLPTTSTNSLYLHRTKDGDYDNFNPYVAYVAVYRAMNPVLTAITFDGVDADQDSEFAFSVTLPQGTNLGTMTVTPIIVWNGAGSAAPTAAWAWGDNTYRVTDKDGDYTDYTITLTEAAAPSAAPVITAQPEGANYIEGASIAELAVVATGSGELSYQWYLGAEAIEGATAATYAPAVSAVGSYVYHCVVTNTEAGHPATSLASDNATITISEDPNAIKLINKSTGAINTTNFITGVTATEVNSEKAAAWGNTQGTFAGLNNLTKLVQYNATTTKTKVSVKLYSTNNNAKEVYLHKILEGSTTDVVETIPVSSNTPVEAEYTFDNAKNRSIYLATNSTDVKILQVKVVESGEALPMFGQAGYSLNLNKGRIASAKDVDMTFEGMAYKISSAYGVINSTEFKVKSADGNPYKMTFTVNTPVVMTITESGSNYYVYKVAEPQDKGDANAAGTKEYNLTAGTWVIESATTSEAKFTNIAFELPKAATPVIVTQPATNHTFNPGDMTATVVATVSEGTLHYQWYKKATVGDDEEVGTDAATLTTTTEGTYYVVVTNSLAGHQDVSVTSDEAELGYRVTNDATLMALSASAGTLDPVFDKNEENYSVNLAMGTTVVPTLTATATMNGYANVAKNEATEFVNYEAVSTVVVTSEDGTATKTYTVHFYVDHLLPQVDVTESTTWDWTYAAEGEVTIKVTASTEPIKKNEEGLMANVRVDDNKPTNDATFNSQALLFYGENVRAKDGGRWYASLGHIKFNVTKPGIVEVEFSDNGSNDRCLSINGFMSPASSSKTDIKTFKVFVPAGEVTLMGMEGAAPDKYIRISKITYTVKESPDYTRNVTNNIGTLCVDHNVLVGGAQGATFYQIASRNEQYDYKIDFEEVLPNEELKAGEPYIFQSTTGKIELFYGETAVAAPVEVRGMIGSFANTTLDITETNKSDILYIAQNKLWNCEDLVASDLEVVANRAYIVMSEVPTYAAYQAQQQSNNAPRRRVTLGRDAENAAQGFENILGGDQPMKVMIDGTLYIIRGEKVFDATGRLVK